MRSFLTILTVLLSTLVAASFLGKFYDYFFSLPNGFSGFVIPGSWGNFIDGVHLSYVFSVPFSFGLLGGSKKYWWIGILLIPAAAFEIYFDLAHIYFPIALGLLGWVIGWGISKALYRT